ncbi:MAG TPA: hypothetical protein VFB13_20655 [Reyranella sp.]|nr:hypothetical protein [Reyranella sp.]
MRFFLLGAALFALTACNDETPAEKRADSPYYRPPTPAELACDRQGLVRGTNGYEDCLDRENHVVRALPPVVPTPPAGVQAFQDEYGNRYDGQGNRLDAQGNIIAPPVSKP